jgi:hypothetical protein
MRNSVSAMLRRGLALLAAAVVVKVTLGVLLGYGAYFPPDFELGFLHGRQAYFHGVYAVAFYSHVVVGPVTLLLGLVLVSETPRRRYPIWHRRLGKTQIALILLLLVPSGLWMARFAETGGVAGLGFAGLALATGLCAALGWRTAMQRRFAEHRRWMWRCYLLLCSAVVLRLIGGLATVTGVDGGWTYPLAAWVSWLVPLAAFELGRVVESYSRRGWLGGERQSGASNAALSLPAMETSARRCALGASASRYRTLPSTQSTCSPPSC